MKQNNPFEKLGALDQMLYQDTAAKPQEAQRLSPTDEKLKEDKTSLLANQQTSKPAKKQTSKLANQQRNKLANQQTNEPTKRETLPLSTKEKIKYGTYLREDSILQIKVKAVQNKQKDHELLQEIVDYYFKSHGK